MTASPPDPPAFGAKQPHRADLEHREQRRRGRWRRTVGLVVLALLLAAILAGVWGWKTYLSDLPQQSPTQQALWSLNRAPGMTFQDHEGHVIATRGPKHGYKVALRELPAYVPRAFLAAEDRRFYQHGPVDLRGIARAFRANLKAGQIVQGGSTLTQQLAKTLFLTPDQTLKRKVQEAVIAYRMEQAMSKDEVLELYLNRVFFGANAYGVDAASQTYFGKPAKALSLSEAALLAALPKAPTRLALTNDMPAALARSKTILAAMREEGWITPAQQAAALTDTPKLAPEAPGEGDYGYVLDMAAAQAVALAGDRAPDLIVRLSIEPMLQTTAQAIVRRAVAEEGRRRGATQGALVALAPDGAIRALVGGVDHRLSPFNRATQAQRQPGSSFKALVYATALENGVRPADERNDAPFKLGRWSPENYGGGYHGMVSVETALIHSYNTVSVRLADEVGPAKVGELARRFGIASIPPDPQLSIALGAYEVNLLELTGAYQVFQQGGARQTPYLIESITTSRGDVLYARPPGSTAVPVYDGVHAAEMIKMMRGVIERGTGTRANIGRPAAGKTGTSQSWRDAWFVGFTPDWVCGVWVGNDESLPMRGMKGGDLPAEIWKRFMLVAHQGVPVHDFPLTPGLDDMQTAEAPPPPDKSMFYDTLSSEFARAADEAADEAGDEPAPARPAPEPDDEAQ